MASITHEILPEQGLTLVNVTGQLTTDEILAYSKVLHGQPLVTRLSLWDIRAATMDDTNAMKFRRLEHRMQDVVKNRRDGKTAIVTESDLIYGFGRLYSSYAELNAAAVRYRIFRSMDKALAWLKD